VNLLYESDGAGGLLVYDSRELPEREYRLNANEAAILMAAESPRTASSLKETQWMFLRRIRSQCETIGWARASVSRGKKNPIVS